jgi:hypothetical protein
VLQVNRSQLPLRSRSPFARRVLTFCRQQDPPISIAELARQITDVRKELFPDQGDRNKVSRQSVFKWVWNESIPEPDNITALAKVIGCTVEELRFDLEASKGWQPPISFADFLRLVENTAQAEHWPDINNILPYLRQTVSWQDVDTFSSNFARDVLVSKIPIREKALRLVRIVRAEKELGN